MQECKSGWFSHCEWKGKKLTGGAVRSSSRLHALRHALSHVYQHALISMLRSPEQPRTDNPTLKPAVWVREQLGSTYTKRKKKSHLFQTGWSKKRKTQAFKLKGQEQFNILRNIQLCKEESGGEGKDLTVGGGRVPLTLLSAYEHGQG